MRRVAEAACRVPEVQDINIVETPRGPANVNVTNQWSEGRDLIPELSQPIEEILPSAIEQQASVREDTIREPEVVVEHVPLLNGGPPTSWEESRTCNNFCNYYWDYSHGVCIFVFYTSS